MPADSRVDEAVRVLRRQIAAGGGELLGRGYQAEVRRFQTAAGTLVVKSPHASILLGFFGKRAIRHEWQAYRRLNHVPGTPRAFDLLDDKYLVLEAVDGPALRSHEATLTDRDRFYGQLAETIEAMHAAGVAHGDLKRKDNIIVGPGEQPYLIDYGIACIAGPGAWQQRKFAWFKQLDWNAWIKLKHGRAPESLPPADAARYKPLLIEVLARRLRIVWQKLSLRRPRQRWRKRREQRHR